MRVVRAAASADVFRAIADGHRRELLDALQEGERTVGSLVEVTGMSYSVVSQHLGVLAAADLAEWRADGRYRHYRMTPRPLREVHEWTSTYERFWRERLRRLHRYLDDDQR